MRYFWLINIGIDTIYQRQLVEEKGELAVILWKSEQRSKNGDQRQKQTMTCQNFVEFIKTRETAVRGGDNITMPDHG